VFLALVGLAMITMRSFAVGPGTLLILTAAVLWALHLVALEWWSRAGHLYGLTVIQLATSATATLGCQVLLDDCQESGPPRSAAPRWYAASSSSMRAEAEPVLDLPDGGVVSRAQKLAGGHRIWIGTCASSATALA
jgi:hypothetical protein